MAEMLNVFVRGERAAPPPAAGPGGSPTRLEGIPRPPQPRLTAERAAAPRPSIPLPAP